MWRRLLRYQGVGRGDTSVSGRLAGWLRPRKGSALTLVLLMTLAVAALAVAAIFMTSSAGLRSRFYDQERLHALAAESGLQMVLSRLRTDPDFAVPDTGMIVALPGVPVRDADGAAIPGANVFVYMMVTGDTTGVSPRIISLIARAYDRYGTRHVRRMDVRQAGMTHYTMFIDTIAPGVTIGPAIWRGRLHSNANWPNANDAVIMDSLSAVGMISGTPVTYDGDTVSGVSRVPFPRDSSYAWMAAIAATGRLAHTTVGTGRTRLEFVSIDTDGDGQLEPEEAYVRILRLQSNQPSLLEANPTWTPGSQSRHDWRDRVVQNQCGAFYQRHGRWHFIPVATHRAAWAWTLVSTVAIGDWPSAPLRGNTNSAAGVRAILEQPTSRCFPAGSPYLVNTERMTQSDGTASGTPSRNNFPWGTRGDSTQRYGGSDTTFTQVIRTCTFDQTGECISDVASPFGTWQPSVIRDSALPAGAMRNAHWPLHVSRNSASRGVVSVTGNVYVSGVISGHVTLRVAGNATIVDRLVYAADPNDPNIAACTNQLGLVATGDIVVANSAITRVRRYGTTGGSTARYLLHLGGEPRVTVHGHLVSTRGTVGAQLTGISLGTSAATVDCQGPAGAVQTSGGCLDHTGSAAMRRYVSPFRASEGHLLVPRPDRCMAAGGRPPFFPRISAFEVLRTVQLEPARANTNARIEAILRSLRGRHLE